MKKITAITIVLVSLFITAQADDYAYPYLAFVNTAGNVETLAVDDLQITFADGQLVVVNATTSKTYTLTDMAKMYFSETEETTTDIQGASLMNNEERTTNNSVEVYDLQGRKISGNSHLSPLKPGIYVVRKNGQTNKVSVK